MWLGVLLVLAGLVWLALAGRREVALRGPSQATVDLRIDWLGVITLLHARVPDVRGVRVVERRRDGAPPTDVAWRVELVTARGAVPVSRRWSHEAAPAQEEADRLRALLASEVGRVVAEPASSLGLALGATLLLLGLVVLYGST